VHQAAALAGISHSAALAAADELARADVLRPDDPLEFGHPLLRASVYGALGHHERARTHARAARVLLEEGAPSEQVGAHLLHAAPAGDEFVVEALRLAAASALGHGVPLSAIAYLERALREPPAPSARPEILTMLGRAELLAGRRDAVEHLRGAIDLVEDRRLRAGLWLDLARTLHDFGCLQEACEACEGGLSELGGDDSELAMELQALFLGSGMLTAERAAESHRRASALVARAAPSR
jgi:tetratricopeptide (TPR) repeat protein